MKKRLTTARDTCSKRIKAEMAEGRTVDLTSLELCPEDLAAALFVLKLEGLKPELRRCFSAAKIFLEQFELEVLSGLSDDISLTDYDEITLNRQKRCEHALSEIDLRLCSMIIEARQSAYAKTRNDDDSPGMWPEHDSTSETH